jgi:nickel/cobalt transporter (NiCoT) family protein
LRKIFYNLATTGLSIVVAPVIGSIELAQVLIRLTGAGGGAFDTTAELDFGRLGYLIVGLFLLAWGLSVAIWKLGRLEQR